MAEPLKPTPGIHTHCNLVWISEGKISLVRGQRQAGSRTRVGKDLLTSHRYVLGKIGKGASRFM